MADSEVVKRYFDALAAQDLDAAAACWHPGGVDRMVGEADLRAPEDVRQWFAGLFAAFPDWRFEVLEMASEDTRTAVRWRARATFAGPGTFQGFSANGARLDVEGCDMLTVGDDGLIQSNHAYVNGGDVARQLGLLPDPQSPGGQRLTKLANLRTKLRWRVHAVDLEQIATGVWLARGGFPIKGMNVYLIEDGDGVTVFDAGISDMTEGLRAAAARLGGIKRVVLGHADADHRGAAPGLGAPVYCHPAEREAAESDAAFRPYFDFSKFGYRHSPIIYRRMLPMWDGGAVEIAGTVAEGDELAGFKVYEFPGHAPGLIGLFRDSDRLALVSDVIYTINPETLRPQRPAIPHPAFDLDTDMARASVRKLAMLEPSAVWAGHGEPVKADVVSTLERAAAAPAPA
jgi:glyoxylase-like metal-dependent hydrolase (beta-lactamase superfamily II)/predicted ester cyclase